MKNYELRITNYELRLAKILFALCVFCGLNYSSHAQSTNQNFPTPVTSNEISGKITARDIGDARLTSYFYVFNGRQGDVFINVVTSNLNGDIDVFTANDLKPLTKITFYAGESERETGRVIYLRQPEKLILRIEGRSPNDDAATFRIKFAGSFEPLQATAENAAPDAPVVKSENQSDVVVNSVGTIIEIKPKPTPTPKETIAKNETKPKEKNSRAKDKTIADDDEKEVEAKEVVAENKKQTEIEKTAQVQKQSAPKVIITDEIAEKEKNVEPEKENAAAKTAKTELPKRKAKAAVKAASPAELANINLIVLFKDGSKIERPMSEVLKFNVDKGILTVISKDGAIGRYSILDVEKVTIE